MAEHSSKPRKITNKAPSFWRVYGSVFFYGLGMAGLFGLLKLAEYHYFIRDLSIELYLGLVAVFFSVLGVWAGLKLTRPKPLPAPQRVSKPLDKVQINAVLQNLGISPREYEVLSLIAEGLSNQEIANRMFISLNTVKTHSSNLFLKLDVKRRTQALQKAHDLGLL
jgi:two-component system, NarL family, response regulator LiaR